MPPGLLLSVISCLAILIPYANLNMNNSPDILSYDLTNGIEGCKDIFHFR